jgi:hypothetical protein
MSIRAALKLFVLSLLVFAAAFAARRTFFADVMPVAWGQEPQSLWALGTAFLLRSIENISAAVGAIALMVAVVLNFGGWRARNSQLLTSSPGLTRRFIGRRGSPAVPARIPVWVLRTNARAKPGHDDLQS